MASIICRHCKNIFWKPYARIGKLYKCPYCNKYLRLEKQNLINKERI